MVLVAAGAAAAASTAPSGALASQSTTVSVQVLSATSIDASACPAGSDGITNFGLVLPGSAVVTPADCTVSFGSSNDTAALRLLERDRGGYSMMAGPTSGVVAHWPLNGDTRDVSSGGNGAVLGTGSAQPAWTAGPLGWGQALAFAGAQVAEAANRPSYDLTSQFTVEAWVRTSDISNVNRPTILTKQLMSSPYAQNYGLTFWRDCACPGPALQWGFSTGNAAGWRSVRATAAPVVDGQWHHVAGTYAGGVLRLHVDGVEVASQAVAGTPDALATQRVYVGRDGPSGGNPLIGDIDEVRISDVARSKDQLRSYTVGRISDYDATANPWSGAGPLFGACLRQATNATAVWSSGGACPTSDGSWNAIADTNAATGAVVARTTTAGTIDAQAALRFGMKLPSGQAPGTYTAPVDFEVVAPSV